MRAEVRAFAAEMEKQLVANDHKGGWKDCTIAWLDSELCNHLVELRRRIRAHRQSRLAEPGRKAILDDAADVANFAMMMADVCGVLEAEDQSGDSHG